MNTTTIVILNDNQTWGNIAGATASNLVLTEALVGKAISMVANYTDGRGTAESMTSSATSVLIDTQCNSDAFDPGTGLRISIEELVNTWQAQQREIAQ